MRKIASVLLIVLTSCSTLTGIKDYSLIELRMMQYEPHSLYKLVQKTYGEDTFEIVYYESLEYSGNTAYLKTFDSDKSLYSTTVIDLPPKGSPTEGRVIINTTTNKDEKTLLTFSKNTIQEKIINIHEEDIKHIKIVTTLQSKNDRFMDIVDIRKMTKSNNKTETYKSKARIYFRPKIGQLSIESWDQNDKKISETFILSIEEI